MNAWMPQAPSQTSAAQPGEYRLVQNYVVNGATGKVVQYTPLHSKMYRC